MSNLCARGKQCRAIVSAAMLCLLLAGCGDGGSNGSTPAPATPAAGTVVGHVVSLVNNAPVSGATVKTDSGTITTAADGKFSIAAPAGDRTIVRVEANGFADAFPVVRVTSGQTTNLGVKLVPIGTTATVSVAAGGTVSNSTARLTIPADSLVPQAGGTPAGSVTVSLTPLNPAVDTSLMPGGFNGVPPVEGQHNRSKVSARLSDRYQRQRRDSIHSRAREDGNDSHSACDTVLQSTYHDSLVVL